MGINFLSPVFFVIWFVCLWTGISLIISLIGGWFELGRSYRATRPFQGERWRFQDAYLRLLSGYRGVLTVGSSPEGLYLAVIPIFRVGHPPLLISWQDISVHQAKVFWVRVYEFNFRQVPSVRLRLKEKVAKKIQDAAGTAWPGDRSAARAPF